MLESQYSKPQAASGDTTYDRGTLFTGPKAKDNLIYAAHYASSVKTDWGLDVTEIYINGALVTAPQGGWCRNGCFVDTGTPNVHLPGRVCKAAGQASMDLVFKNGGAIRLKPGAGRGTGMWKPGVTCSDSQIILGLPIFNDFYVIFNDVASTVEFVGLGPDIAFPAPAGYELVSSGSVCPETERIPLPCGSCGPDWGDLSDCEGMCSALAHCSHITYFEDKGCRTYSACDLTKASPRHPEAAGTDIYKRNNPAPPRVKVHPKKFAAISLLETHGPEPAWD